MPSCKGFAGPPPNANILLDERRTTDDHHDREAPPRRRTEPRASLPGGRRERIPRLRQTGRSAGATGEPRDHVPLVRGTFLALVTQPDVTFQDGNPVMLTTEGEFVIKNLILLSAVLVLYGRRKA